MDNQATLQDKTGAPVVVKLVPQYSAYQIAFADNPDRAVGMTMFVDRPETQERFFFHTEVKAEFGGRGLAGILVDEAMRAPENQRLTIVAICTLVREWLKTHPDTAPQWRRPNLQDLTFVKNAIGA